MRGLGGTTAWEASEQRPLPWRHPSLLSLPEPSEVYFFWVLNGAGWEKSLNFCFSFHQVPTLAVRQSGLGGPRQSRGAKMGGRSRANEPKKKRKD